MFAIEDSPEGQLLVVTGPWSKKAEARVASGAVDGLVLNYARGFEESSLDFLDAWPLRHLHVLDRSARDLAPVSRLAATLESLRVQVALGTRLDLGELPKLKRLSAWWDVVEGTFHEPAALEEATLMEYGRSSLTAVAMQPTLRELRIKLAPLLESLAGVEDLSGLERLQIVGARELVDLSALAARARSLIEFEIQSCLGVDAIDDLGRLHKLRLLGVNDCGRIETIRPLVALTSLQTFLAWESTRVMDNDLSPLLALPELHEVRMRDRRDYRPRVSEIQALLATRA